MKEIDQRLVKGASKALAALTKTRCVVSYTPTPEAKFKTLYAWPTQHPSDEDAVSILAQKGLEIPEFYSVKALEVQYGDYKKLDAISVPEVATIKSSRILLDVFKIATGNIENITAAWDTLEQPNRDFPRSMSDTQALTDFANFKDSMLVFKLENHCDGVKLRAHAYKEVLKVRSDIGSFPILPSDRREVLGDNVDDKGRSIRYVVHRGNKDHLEKVLRQTSIVIAKLFGSRDDETGRPSEIRKLAPDGAF